MSFVRAEVRAGLWRWREVITGAGLLTLGLYWALVVQGLIGWIGWTLVLCGIALAAAGIQRARFRGRAGGPGVVTVDEGQIVYFGPLTGGAVAARDLERLTLDPSARPAHWILTEPGQPPLQIPVNAEGADALFDVFATLPGLRTERMLKELQGGSVHPVVIWEKTPLRSPAQRLH